MSRIVIVIFHRHKHIHINYKERLHGTAPNEALEELRHFDLYYNMNHQNIRMNATSPSPVFVHFVHLVQRNARS
jgi:hypothetical protein